MPRALFVEHPAAAGEVRRRPTVVPPFLVDPQLEQLTAGRNSLATRQCADGLVVLTTHLRDS